MDDSKNIDPKFGRVLRKNMKDMLWSGNDGAELREKKWKATPEYNSWTNMKQRCLNPNSKAYKYYGGRGITIHPEWVNDFKAFYAYVGDKPSPSHSIDRINNDGNYEPGNVRWATKREQVSNRRALQEHTTGIKGVTKCRDGYAVRLYVGDIDIYIGFSLDINVAKSMHLAATRTFEALEKIQSARDAAKEREAEQRGVAWTIGVVDDVHIHTDSDLNAYDDKIFKGIKNTIRDRYKFITGIDPAPSYPVNVELYLPRRRILMDNELFELCKEVYERTDWDNRLERYYVNDNMTIGLMYDAEILPPDTKICPLYTSDHLLEKLPPCLLRKRADGWYVAQWITETVVEAEAKEDTPLKALLKLVLALDDASELRKGE